MRPRRLRRISFSPEITYFKPAGARLAELKETIITKDELEAVRLKDLKGLEQTQAAKKMNISQPTFHRLVLEARKKIADSLVNGKAIRIQGGDFKMVAPRGQGRRMGRGQGPGQGRGVRFQGPADNCICPICGYKKTKQPGIPCASQVCPKCKRPLTRE